jgi:hypothetical protein
VTGPAQDPKPKTLFFIAPFSHIWELLWGQRHERKKPPGQQHDLLAIQALSSRAFRSSGFHYAFLGWHAVPATGHIGVDHRRQSKKKSRSFIPGKNANKDRLHWKWAAKDITLSSSSSSFQRNAE